ncbi:MAG: CsbD family protein [Nitrospirales bacterium]
MKVSWHRSSMTGPAAFAAALILSAPVWASNGLTYSSYENQGQQSDYIHQVYNEDQFKGNWEQMKGALKEQWGDFTDDDLMVIQGKSQKFEGKLQERYGDRKEEVKTWVDEWMEKHPYDAKESKH